MEKMIGSEISKGELSETMRGTRLIPLRITERRIILLIGDLLLLNLATLAALWLFAGIVGSYLLANLAASIIAASRGGWRYLPILPIIFSTMHVAWGLGFLWSLALAAFAQVGRLTALP
jgi:hypothetical protein